MSAQALPAKQTIVYQPNPRSHTLKFGESSVPIPGPDECLIAVKATSPILGELTWEVLFPSLFPQDTDPLLRVPCTEGAGVIVTSPPNSQFKPGDEVFYRTLAKDPGSLRKFTTVKADLLALKPTSMDWVAASATALSSLTALQGLFDHAGLERGALWGGQGALERNSKKTILVTGASGNVGMWLVKLASLAGCKRVIGVSGPSKVKDVLELGATEVIDYTKQTIASWAGQDETKLCDVAIDCTGGESLSGCWYAVKEDGIILSVCESPADKRPPGISKKLKECKWYLMPCSNTKDLTDLASLIDTRKLTQKIDSVFEFEGFEEAFARVVSGKTRGKVVIKVDC